MPLLSLAIASLSMQSEAKLRGLVKRIDSLQPREMLQFKPYGERAFRLIKPIAERRLAEYRRFPNDSDAQRRAAGKLQTAVSALCWSAGPRETHAIAQLESKLPEEAAFYAVMWLCETGKPTVPTLTRIIRRQGNDQYAHVDARAVTVLIKTDPSAAARVLLPLLVDETARPEIRKEIYCRLGGVRVAGVHQALARIRDGGAAILPPLNKRLPLPTHTRWPEWVKGKRNGYGLVYWGPLGDSYSLWVMKWTARGWTDPVFTGRAIHGDPEYGHRPDAQMRAYCASGLWLDDLTWLRRDLDRDGYTDVVEDWLGTKRDDPDTDGDGILDGIDKNPTAGMPPLTDAQKVIHAALGAHSFTDEDLPLIINLPPNVSPFTFNRWSGLVRFPSPLTRPESIRGLHIKMEAPVFSNSKTATIDITESASWYDKKIRYRAIKTDFGWLVIASDTLSTAVS